MSIAMPTVSRSGQVLIDARLETIEQTLLGRMPRSERLTIVREVESQIHELLAEAGVDEASREDVLAVLGRLDPPEAYISDEESGGFERFEHRRTRSVPPASPTAATRGRADWLAIAGGVVGLCGLAWFIGMVLMYSAVVVLGVEVNETFAGFLEIILVATPLLTGAASLTSLIIAAYTRVRSRWSIAGAVSSALSLLGTGLCILYAFALYMRS